MFIFKSKNIGKICGLQRPVKQMSIRDQWLLSAIQRRVRLSEKRFISQYGLPQLNLNIDERVCFETIGPQRPIYSSTPPEALLHVLFKIQFPKGSRFADWGSGFGSACFAAALTRSFKEIVGYEIDQRLFNEAEKIRIKCNWNNTLTNVRFENKNFLEVDPQPYGMIFVYWPFFDNFSKLMSEKLKNIKPGTFIVSHAYHDTKVFSRDHFKLIYPDHLDFSTPDFLPGIYVFIRK